MSTSVLIHISPDHSACRPHPYCSHRPPISPTADHASPHLTASFLTATIPHLATHSSPPPFFTPILRAHSSPPIFDTTPACRFLAFALFAARAVLPSLSPPQSRRTSQRGLVLRLGSSGAVHAFNMSAVPFSPCSCHQYPWFGFRVSRRRDVPSHDATPTPPVQFL